MEEWKPIVGHVGYEISTMGRVRSYRSINGRGTLKDIPRLLKPTLDCYGYYKITIDKRSKTISRLMGIAFLPNPDNKPTIDHINQIRTDNRIENLRWATYTEQIENQRHSIGILKELYIYPYLKNKFIVNLKRLKISKTFKTLEEAIQWRNKQFE